MLDNINSVNFNYLRGNTVRFNNKPSEPQILDKKIDIKDFLNTRNYFIPFLGKKDYSDNEREFLNFRKAFATKLHHLSKDANLAQWNFETNSNDETRLLSDSKMAENRKIFQDEKIYTRLNQFKEKGINDPALKRHLNELIREFDENIKYKSELEDLDKKQSEISQKFNQAGPFGAPGLIANELVDLVKTRNEFAKKQGYSDYYSYMLDKTYNVDEKQLFELLDSLKEKTDNITNEIKNNKVKNLFFAGMDQYIQDREDLLPLTKELYKKMGWDIDKLPVKYDIFPRPNKNRHGFCFPIDTPKDTRILANLRADMQSLKILNHETGHAVYNSGISSHIPYFDRNPASSALTEAVAMLIETLPIREEKFLQENLNIPEPTVKRLGQMRKLESMMFVGKALKLIHFEKEMYKNPDQNLGKLWNDLGVKFEGTSRVGFKNEWASVPHYLMAPGYYQNYLRAELMASQIHDSFEKQNGKMIDNPKTEEFFRKKMFRVGSGLSEDEMMIKLTGTNLKSDAFCREMETLIENPASKIEKAVA